MALRLSSNLLGQLANPSFADKAGMAIGAASLAPELRDKEEKKQGMFGQIQEAITAGDQVGAATAMMEYGKEFKDQGMLLRGAQMSADITKFKGSQTVANLLEQANDPTLTTEQRAKLMTQAKAIAPNAQMSPQTFNSLSNTARASAEQRLNNAAMVAASSNKPNGRSMYVDKFGETEAWRFDKALAGMQRDQASMVTSDRTLTDSSFAPEVNALKQEMAQLALNPTGDNLKRLLEAEQQMIDLQTQITNAGGTGDAAKYTGFTGKAIGAYQDNLEKQRKAAKEARDRLVTAQTDYLYGGGIAQSTISAEDFISEARGLTKEDGSLVYDFTEKEWAALTNDIQEAQQKKVTRAQELQDGRVGAEAFDFLKKNPGYFDNIPGFNDDLKAYQDEKTSPLLRKAIGVRLNKYYDDAMAQQRKDNRTEGRLEERARTMVDDYLRSGDENDPMYDPRYVHGGGFGQGDSRYDVVDQGMRRDTLNSDFRDRLLQEVETQIRNNDNIGYRDAVNNALDIMKVEIPGEAAANERQRFLNQAVQENQDAIKAKKKQVLANPEAFGFDPRNAEIDDREAYRLVLIDEIAENERENEQARMAVDALRRDFRRSRYGENPFMTPPTSDLED